jgi:hypothetical protein
LKSLAHVGARRAGWLALLAAAACHGPPLPLDSGDPRRVLAACKMEAQRAFATQPSATYREGDYATECMTAHGWELQQGGNACGSSEGLPDAGSCWLRLGPPSNAMRDAAAHPLPQRGEPMPDNWAAQELIRRGYHWNGHDFVK